jgi:hypothetical protein
VFPLFWTAIFVDRGAYETHLAARARAELGVEMNIRLSLDAERTLNRIDVKKELLVTVSDFDDAQHRLTIKVGVEVDPENRTVAILQCDRYDEIHAIVPEQIERFIRHSVTMHAFSTQLAEPSIRQPLIRHLDGVLRTFGRKVGTLTLAGDDMPDDLYFLQDDVDVLCNLRNYSRAVKINSRVQMNLVDLARYRTAKSPPLKKWLRENLERIVPELLFESRYIDVLLRFPTREQCIRERLADRAAAIGYELKQFITLPDLELTSLTAPFPVSVEGEFPTRRSDVSVKLRFDGVVHIPQLEKIEDKLDADHPIPAAIQEAIRQRVVRYMHAVTPDRYYTQFEHTDSTDQVTVEAALEAEIRDELKTAFHCNVLTMTVKPVATEPMERLKALQQQISDLTVEVATLHAPVPIVFCGKFQVEGVDSTLPNSEGWHRFHSRRATVEEIRKHLEAHLRAILQPLPLRELLYQTDEEQQALSNRLSNSAQDYTRMQFGLAISVDSITREQTELEQRVHLDDFETYEARLRILRIERERTVRVVELLGDQREAQLQKLLEKGTDRTGVDDDEAADYEPLIAKAQSRIDEAQIPGLAKLRAAVLPERAGNGGAPAPAGRLLDASPDEHPDEKQSEGGTE